MTNEKMVNKPLKLQRTLGRGAAIVLCFNGIVGSGIFVSPQGIVRACQTAGMSMIMWVAVGVLALLGALCYVELGLIIPKTGGEYAIFDHVYGPRLAFMFAWLFTTVVGPGSMAISSLTSVKYILSLFGFVSNSDFECIGNADKYLAVAVVWIIIAINAFSIKLNQELTRCLGYIKILSLSMVILIGFYAVATGTSNFDVFKPENSFLNVTGEYYLPSISELGTGLYAGVWAYNGWNKLNMITEEIIDPEKNLLIAIVSAVGLIIVFYSTVNFMYFTVLGLEGILNSNAVAADFAKEVVPSLSFIAPIMVACSCAGIALVQCFTAARIPFAAGRNGQMPRLFGMLHIERMTPLAALILMGVMASGLILGNDISALLNYFGFANWSIYGASFTAVIIMRRRNVTTSAFAVPIVIPYVVLLFSIYLAVNPFYVEFCKKLNGEEVDLGYLYVVLWTGFGLLLSELGGYLEQTKLSQQTLKLTRLLQRLLMVAPEEKE